MAERTALIVLVVLLFLAGAAVMAAGALLDRWDPRSRRSSSPK